MLKFDEKTHTYTLDGKVIPSVTQFMKEKGLSPSYDNIDPEVLRKKAERGKMIHKELENWNLVREEGFTTELYNYQEYMYSNKLIPLFSEITVCNGQLAGTIDVIYTDENHNHYIADYKTTSVLDLNAVSWQLSFYKYLLQFSNLPASVKKLHGAKVFWFKNDGSLYVKAINLHPMSEIKEILESKIDLEPQKGLISKSLLDNLINTNRYIENLKLAQNKAEKKLEDFKAQCMKLMKEHGVYSYENENIKITYMQPTVRVGIDATRLKAEQPNIAKEYQKLTKVNESIRITLRGKENEC